jgi:hypothetical protein
MNNKKQNKRKNALEGAKILLVSLSITAIVFFWAKFSRADQIADTVDLQNSAAAQESYVISIPTLVPVEVGEEDEEDDEKPSTQPLELRSVSAPAPQQAPSGGGPIIVKGGGGGGGSPTTSTGSS